ncbi:SPOR domain-containing protein [Prosthecochloris sp. N3]|uniref:SPOR domain-containing protein n=1 Tax=Prosthecochloris ethylica TaxID=2743976 RepID=A0ABR9XSS9_9CHLB|nr:MULTISPECIES: SPOR domain-containing protein [Prosthecochloris]MBF0585597.1 SPOR domain-containing protein [Prosthecochloris ethylica]MBF0637110.1 SPOR domain-containing protein [Prosthecochloris ethylica]NUK46827.1 SPOR domain-containing protein [Prosthecochloris ethylica]RNA64598.1 SPOR domain-containing protein [Prosthecochloris sp. ZM_2]
MSTFRTFSLITMLIAASMIPSMLHAQTTGYSNLILQYVQEDKVYLLENLRQRVTRPSERTVIEALLTEDGPRAARLFHRQLKNHPDPALDALSRQRLNYYAEALGTVGTQQPGTASPASSPRYILQFGSFGSRQNAQEFSSRISNRIPVTITEINGLHKVRSKTAYPDRKQAEAAGASLPFSSLILQER